MNWLGAGAYIYNIPANSERTRIYYVFIDISRKQKELVCFRDDDE